MVGNSPGKNPNGGTELTAPRRINRIPPAVHANNKANTFQVWYCPNQTTVSMFPEVALMGADLIWKPRSIGAPLRLSKKWPCKRVCSLPERRKQG